MKPSRLVDVLLVAALISLAAAGHLPPHWTSGLPAATGHFLGFAVVGAIGATWIRQRVTLSWPWAAVITWLGCVSVGAADELRQLLLSARHGDTGDLLVDCLGAAAGVVCAGLLQRVLTGSLQHESSD